MRGITEINNVITDIDLSIKERIEFIESLSEDEMRSVFVQMCSAYATNKR